MARDPRITTRGLTQQIFSRCIEKRDMLQDTFASDLLIEVLRKTQDKYVFELIAYQIMYNHFHFVIKTVPGGASISRIMQFIKSGYARKYNKHTNRTGPFWNERFKDIIIDDAENPKHYLLWLLWYLAFNPARKMINANPRKYKYSSIKCYLEKNHECPLKITFPEYFMELGSSFSERVKAFLWYEEAYRKRWPVYF